MSQRPIFFTAVITAIALWAVSCGGGASSGGVAGGQNVTVNMTEFKFDPPAITVTAGQVVNLTMVNKGSVIHTWVVPGASIKFSVEPGKTATKSFTAPKAGTYDITCDEAGHKESGMAGQLIVK